MNNLIKHRGHSRSTRKGTLVALLISALLAFTPPTGRADVWVVTPDASTTVYSGTPAVIRWSDDLESPLVNVELWDGVRGTTTVLARNVAAPQREIFWTVPEDVQTGNRYRFVIRDTRDTRRAVFSAGFTNLVRRSQMPTGVYQGAAGVFSMDIAPIPASDRVRISWSEPIRRIEIMDLTGATLIRLDPTPGALACSVNTAALSSASYSVVAYTGAGSVIRRPLLIQR